MLNFLYVIRDLTCSTRDEPVPPALKARDLNHWIAREIPIVITDLSVAMLIPMGCL